MPFKTGVINYASTLPPFDRTLFINPRLIPQF